MADQNDIEVRFGADTSELDGASKEAAQNVQSVSDTMKTATTSVTSYSNSLTAAQRYTQQATEGHKQMARAAQDSAQAAQDLAGKYGAAGTQAAEFGKGLRALNDQLKAGTITQAEHAAQLASLRASVFGAGQATEDATKSVLNFGMSTSHAINGVRALTDELSSGRIHQAQGTFTRLFLEFAAANPEIAAIAAAIIVLGGSFAAGAVHAEEFDRAINGIEVALTAVGHAGDFSKQQLEQYINTLSQAPNISRESAEEILAEFARMPEISRPVFDQLQGMVSDFATATGTKAPQAAKELANAFEDPVKGALKLDKQLNFLTSTQILAIQKADEHGDRMKAQAMLADALEQRIKGLTRDAMTPLQQAENDCSTAWKNFMDALGKSGAIDVVRRSVVALLDTLTSAIQSMKQLMTLKGILNASAAIGAQDAGVDSSQYTNNVLAAGTATQHAAAQASVNDQLREQEKHHKEILKLAMEHSGKATERRKLEQEINQLLSERKNAGTADERKIFDEAIAADREKLTNLNKPKKVSHAGQATQMDQWRAQFEQMKAQSLEQTGQEDYQAEIKFWQERLAQSKAGSKQYIEVENEISRLRIAAARTGNREAIKADKEAYDAKIATLKEEQAEAAGNLPKQIAIEQQMLDAAKARYGEQSKEYQKMLAEMAKLKRQYALELANDDKAELNRAMQTYTGQLQVESAQNQARLKLHQITQEQMTQLEIAEENKRYQAQQTVLQLELQKYQQFPKQYQQVLTQIEQAETQHNVKMAHLQAQLVEQQRAMWTAAGNAAERAFSSSLQGILRGTTTFQGMMSNIGLAIADSFIESGVKMAANWVAQQLGMTAATAAANATSGASSIATQAAVGAASAYASTAAIPVTGPELAPAAAAAAYGNIMAFQGALTVASAAGGWEVPRDQLMQVHEKEVVLPRAWAERFKQVTDNQAASNAGAGGQSPAMAGSENHLHIHATDAKSFERLLSDSSSHLHGMVQKWVRNGKF